MEAENLINLSLFTPSQRILLAKGKLRTVEDLLLSPLQDISRKCKVSPLEAQGLIDTFCKGEELSKSCRLSINEIEDEVFTSGDSLLDDALQGGFRTGMLWDIAGESAAGKTQLGLQLSLCVQLSPENGGLSGSTCYLTTSSMLPTNRLLEISKNHPLLEPSICTLDNVHTLSVPTIPVLIHVLSKILPNFIVKANSSRPVKLVVIDSLAELFHVSGKTTTSSLVERSRNIAHIAALLHKIASNQKITIVVLNEVIDAIGQPNVDPAIGYTADVVYSEQSRWFNSANSLPGENRKETSLGLAWANQVNNRIILTRTGRRRYLDGDEVQSLYKRFKDEQNQRNTPEIDGFCEQEALLVRRLSIVFSSLAVPRSLDYIITKRGFLSLSMVETQKRTMGEIHQARKPVDIVDEVSSSISLVNDNEVDWDSLLPAEDSYEGVDWDALEESLADSISGV